MDTKNEIKRIVDSLSQKGRYRDIDTAKLKTLFENSELNIPESVERENFSFEVFKDEAVDEKSPFFVNAGGLLSKVRPLFVPVLAVLVITFAFIIRGVIDDSRGEYGEIYSVKGNVKLLRGNRTLYLSKDDRILQGDTVAVEKNSHVDITVDDCVHFRIAENSSVRIDELTSGDNRYCAVSLARGRCYASVKKISKEDRVIINTPFSVGIVRGTVFGVSCNKDRARYEVFDGKIKVKGRICGIDEGNDIDEQVLAKLRDYFKDHSAVTGKNQFCTIEANVPVISKCKGKECNGLLKDINLPLVGTFHPEKSLMFRDISDFMQSSFNAAGGRDRYPFYISVKPDNARVSVDGVKDQPGLFLLDKGKHVIRVASKGYHDKEFPVTLHKPMQSMTVSLQSRNNAYGIWFAGLRAPYVFYHKRSNYLISVSSDGIVSASDFKNVKWTLRLGAALVSKPLILDGKLYAATEDNRLQACDLFRGQILWSREIPGRIAHNPGLAHDGSRVYIATLNGLLYCMNHESGIVLWEKMYYGSVKSGPVISKSMAFIALENGRLYGIRIETGSEKRKAFFDKEIVSLAVSHDAVYLLAAGGAVFCYNYLSDSVQWNYGTGKKEMGNLTVNESSVYAYSSDGEIVKLDLSGRVVWRMSLGNDISVWPAEDDEKLYFSGEDSLFVVDKKTGGITWSVVVNSLLTRTIAVSDDKIYLVSGDKGLMVLNKN